jgi:hypothetical protein
MQITIRPKLEFKIDSNESWRVKTSRRFLTEGGTKRRYQLIPSTDCFFSRVMSGFACARLAYAKARPGTLVLDCAEGRRLVAINVSHKHPVCIDVRRAIAMSTTVRLRTCVSFSLAAASANHVFVKQAFCPRPETSGVIVLETAGEPTSATGQNSTFEVSRMIAWDPGIEFRTTRLETLGCIFFQPVCVSASAVNDGDSVLLDADDTSAAFSPWKGIRRALSLVIPGL